MSPKNQPIQINSNDIETSELEKSMVEFGYIDSDAKYRLLADLASLPDSVLLDSAGNNSKESRFDIFCCFPTIGIEFDGKEIKRSNQATIWQDTQIDENAQNIAMDHTNPLNYMRHILENYSNCQIKPADQIPFNGGWLGYISYDFGRTLENLPQLAKDDIGLPLLKMGLYQIALVTDHKLKTTRLYNFGLSTEKWQIVVDFIVNSLACQMNDNGKPIEAFQLKSNWKSNISRQEYLLAFDKIKEYILAGDCYQVNFAQRFSCDYCGNLFSAYIPLAQANKAPFSAYINCGDHQILSLSPERFIEAHQGQVKTQPIKGTRPRLKNQNEDLAIAEELKSSVKDRAENLMIVDLLRNDLSKTAAKASVKVTELFELYSFTSVHHLISTITSTLKDNCDNFDILKTTLPGGSITGAPKIRAMEIIEELEPVRRNLYCGIIGYIDFNGNMDTNICIRTIIGKDNKLHVWAGGGLVADSNAEQEYQETFDKLSKILPVIGNWTDPNFEESMF